MISLKNTLTPEQINQLLDSTRDQKFRGYTEAQLQGFVKKSYQLKEKRKDKNSAFNKKLLEANANRTPEHHANQQAAVKEAIENGNWRERQREGAKRTAQNPEWRKKVAESNRKLAKDPKWRKAQAEGVKKAMADPFVKRKHLLSIKTKPVRVIWGVFDGPGSACKHPDATVKYDTLRRNLKLKKPGYEYITWAEHDEIMGITNLPQSLDK
jgi:hypothetical protein